jgi:hypothetical protein
MLEENEHVAVKGANVLHGGGRGIASWVPAAGMSPPVRRRRGPDWLHPGWSWTVGQAWVITALSASVTLILGAVLGALPALLAGNWSDPQTRFQTWVLIGFAVIGLVAAVIAIVLYRKRRWVLHQNGTAYVVRELASDWARQEEKAFLDSAGRYFARVIKVPGPGQLGRSWDWPLGAGAQHWDGKIDELAHSFQALRSVDDPDTPNGVLMWASWAVAVAFGLRVTAADRDLVLDVWQRPSHGRAGDVEGALGTQRPHRFGDAEPVPWAELLPESAPCEFTWHAKLTTTQRGTDARRAADSRVSVLLLRLGYQRWGPLSEADTGSQQARALHLEIHDAAGVTPHRSSGITIHELRCLPPSDGKFPWHAIPSLVTASADWIERKSAELAGHTMLLGATMLPETALGLGITAGHAQRTRWPENIWPVVYQTATDSLVVPHLNLGKAAWRHPASAQDPERSHEG